MGFLDNQTLETLNALSPFAALIVIVGMFVVLLTLGIKSMNGLLLTFQGLGESQKQMVVALSTITATLQNYGDKIETLADRTRESVDQIAQLRLDLDRHVIAINVRFDQLPGQIQSAVIGEWMKYAQNGHGVQRRGWLARLFG